MPISNDRAAIHRVLSTALEADLGVAARRAVPAGA